MPRSLFHFLLVPLAGVMGLPTEGLREPVGQLPDLFATLGPRRVPEREDLALVLLPVLLPAFALVTVPEEVKDRFFCLSGY